MDNNQTIYNMKYVMLCCTVAAFGGLLMGYDTSIISGAIEPLSEYFKLTPAETGWAVSNILIGSLVGCFAAPKINDKFGRKMSLLFTAILFTVSVIGTALAHNFTTFVLFRILGGLAVGLASVISPIYLAELSPSKFRGQTSSLYGGCSVAGQAIVLLTNYFIARTLLDDVMVDVGWRYILATALIPCALFMLFIAFIPESPRWNVMTGKHNEALRTLTKISDEKHALRVLEEIKESFSKDSADKRTKAKIDKKTFPILLVGIGLAIGCQISGINVIQYFGPTLLKNVAGSMDSAMLQTFMLAVSQFVGVLVGMYVSDKLGRRVLLLTGAVGSAVSLAYSFISFYYHFPGFLSVIGLFTFMFFFGTSWGTIIWTVLGEIFPTEIRSKCVGICVCALSMANFVISTTFPIMNSSQFLQQTFHGGFPLLVFAICSVLTYFFTYRYLPETKGIPLERVTDVMLEKYHANKKSVNSSSIISDTTNNR